MSEVQAPAAKRPATEVESVTMTDGRTVGFAGKRKMLKNIEIAEDSVSVRFDFRNGETRTKKIDLADPLFWQYAGHGASQKIGDETSDAEEVEDMVVAVDDILARLALGDWKIAKTAGDGFSGASVVIKAIGEATGKSAADVKAFLQKKLDDDKARGGKLSRQALYASFRQSSTVGPIIERLEKDKAKKAVSVNADDLMNELAA